MNTAGAEDTFLGESACNSEVHTYAVTLKSCRYLQLEAELSKLGVDESSGAAGRVSSFEVTVDGHLVYSKLAKGTFPDMKALARQVGPDRGSTIAM